MSVKEILIGGQFVKTNSSFAVDDPYTGDILANVSVASVDDIQNALSAAASAAKEMKELPRYRIAAGLRSIAEEISKNKEHFCKTIVAESAKPYSTAMGEVERGIATFMWAAGEAERNTGEVVPMDTVATGIGKTAFTKRVPRGVIYGITPFNFPLNLVAHKVAPALAAKNSIIIKPSPKTPLTSLLLGEAFLKSGLPAGALQVVPMETSDIDLIYKDERVAMISFTGSDEIGWQIKSKIGIKNIALELGGNAPVIIDSSADIERSVKQCVTGAFAFAGQVCISVQRILVHSDIYDEWQKLFLQKVSELIIGDPAKPETQFSVMIDQAAAQKAESIVSDALQKGAVLLAGGKRDGSFFEPTVLSNTSADMKAVMDEAFSPIVTLDKFNNIYDAVEIANASKFGLQAGVFTNDLANSRYAEEALDFGGVIINDVPTFRTDNMPYGGVKHSGFGREGIRYAMDEMSEIKLIVHS